MHLVSSVPLGVSCFCSLCGNPVAWGEAPTSCSRAEFCNPVTAVCRCLVRDLEPELSLRTHRNCEIINVYSFKPLKFRGNLSCSIDS